MKKIFITLILCITVQYIIAKDFTLSLNYLFIRERVNTVEAIPKDNPVYGIGLQGDLQLKNNLYLIADCG